jgi:hypothetical protein
MFHKKYNPEIYSSLKLPCKDIQPIIFIQCVADPGSRILDPNFSILDPGPRIKKIPDPRMRIRIKEFKYF